MAVRSEPQNSPGYDRVKAYIQALHDAGHYEILSSSNIPKFIVSVLKKKNYTEFTEEAVREVVALDRNRRLVFQFNPELRVDSDEKLAKMQQKKKDEIRPQKPDPIQSASHVPKPFKNDLGSEIGGKYDSNRARKALDAGMNGVWDFAKEVKPTEMVHISELIKK